MDSHANWPDFSAVDVEPDEGVSCIFSNSCCAAWLPELKPYKIDIIKRDNKNYFFIHGGIQPGDDYDDDERDNPLE